MPANDLIGARLKVLGSAKVTIATVSTPTIVDVNLGAAAAYSPGDRIVVVFDSSTTGSTDTTGFSVQDAPDNAGAIGTPADATVDASLVGGTGDRYTVVGVRVVAGRPWLRLRATRASGTTDSTVVQAIVLAIPPTL